MKNILILMFLGLCFTGFAQTYKKKIYIWPQFYNQNCKNDDGRVLGDKLSKELAALLKKELPCFIVTEHSEFIELLKKGKEAYLAYTGDGAKFDDDNFRKAQNKFINVYYLIPIVIKCYGDKVSVNAIQLNTRQGKSYSRMGKVGDPTDEDFIKSFAKDFLAEIMYTEPCPFKGTIQIDDIETTKIDSINDMGCEKHVTKEERKTIRKIELNKIGKRDAQGSFVSTIEFEKEYHISIQDCHICSMDGTDFTVIRNGDYTKDIFERANCNISGIASYKSADSTINASEAIIHFDRNGTYTLEVKAVSAFGQFDANRTTKVNSTCASQNYKKNGPISFKTNDWFKHTFGPFKGTPFDKVLKESVSVEYPGDKLHEKHKVNFQFNLSRE